ncbi:MAG: dienelactone hydrolase family protein [Gemmatimonadota bacterium]|nr:dienelactone hydrolase family protein [Gemmatimonadota bacterium]
MFGVVLLALLCNAPCVAAPADTAVAWRYDLRAGDHLVYREVFRQEIDGSTPFGLGNARDKPFGTPFVSAARYEWSSHLLVLHAADDRLLVGVQRDRARDDSIVTSLDTSSALSASDRARLQSRLRGRARFAQANLFTATGDAMRPWAARREMRSKILWDAFELPSLPTTPLRVGDHWQSTDSFAFDMHVAGTDALGGETCLRAKGTASAAALIPRQVADSSEFTLEFWYCPSTHAVKRVVLEGTYPDVNFYKVHERTVFDLVGRTRGEATADWMRSADLRQGALAAAALGDSAVAAATLATPGVDSIYASADTASARMLLALAYRAGAARPSADAMTALLASGNPRVRALAVRMLARGDATSARTQLERAASDSDYFVRAAAARVLLTDSVTHTAGAPACTIPDSTRERLAHARRSAQTGFPSGTTFRGMASQSFRGWPYGIYVPDDYLGDEPVPLIIYLAGNSGPAIEGVQLGSAAFERTGYLVVYPNAWGGWWRSNTETMVDSLLKEVMRKYNVDPDRVYLSGLSNGGTGTFDYASLWPQRWTAAVSAMGAGLFGFIEPGGERPFVSNLTHVPMLFLHGKRDQVIAVAATTRTVDSLRAQHADVAMKIFPEREHEIVPGTGDDGATIDYFEHHLSRAIPKKVDFMASTTLHARNYWIEILEKEAPAAGDALKDDASIPDAVRARLGSLVRAEVHGSIDEHNTIHLEAQHVRRLRLLLRPDLFTTDGKITVKLNGKAVFEGPLPTDCTLYARTLADFGDPWLAYSAEMTLDVPR